MTEEEEMRKEIIRKIDELQRLMWPMLRWRFKVWFTAKRLAGYVLQALL